MVDPERETRTNRAAFLVTAMALAILIGSNGAGSFVPIPFVIRHGARLVAQAEADRQQFGVGYLLTVGNTHPALRRSLWWCVGGFIYFLLICAAWIVYARHLGI